MSRGYRAVLTLAWLAVMVPSAQARPRPAATEPLPNRLTLHYTLHYGSVVVGEVVKKLRHERGADYYHSTWTQPAGLAKVFTDVQFLEQGEFRVQHGAIEPQLFADRKTGDSHGYLREVRFDYRRHRLFFKGRPPKPLAPGTQDLDTVFYLFMLHPVQPEMKRLVYVTNGKDVEPYWFVYRGTEWLDTPWGRIETYRVSRMTAGDWKQLRHCTVPTRACQDLVHGFEIWVAPTLNDVAVRVAQTRHGRTLTVTLDRLDY